MSTLPTTGYQQRNNVFSLTALSMIVLLCLQIWLFIEVTHISLGGDGHFSLLATVLSFMCTAGNWQLWTLLHRRIGDFSR
ncbi:MAG: hypothetical protein FJ147_01630 [Deltaproteobacteria bacterium]|nr:hypothetical protein [Deltaproteobacteria bacterium]